MANYAVFIDLENCGAKVETLQTILRTVKTRGNILVAKVYGYTENFSALKEILLSNMFSVVPSIRHGIAQKNNADIQLVVDALEIAYTNTLVDSFCIVSGDSDYIPLVARLRTMGKHIMGLSRSDAASSILLNACNEFLFLESVSSRTPANKTRKTNDSVMTEEEVLKEIVNILEQSSEDKVFASELKAILMRLRPDFSEKRYGVNTFGRFLSKLEGKYGQFKVIQENLNISVALADKDKEKKDESKQKITLENWHTIFREKLLAYKENGFERINPSILKADILEGYPEFNERTIGFKRFSDVMKQLETDKLVRVELDASGTMLVNIL
ncbi:MAG: NYN domain-containing protein [Eubacteriales bacterium]|nr:NYN domain-containing protein [Eubacteriales bacterium]